MSLFGVMRVSHGTESVEDKMSGVVKDLFDYLPFFRCIHVLGVLLGLYWGDYGRDPARKRLNTDLWRLCKVLEP